MNWKDQGAGFPLPEAQETVSVPPQREEQRQTVTDPPDTGRPLVADFMDFSVTPCDLGYGHGV